MLVQAARSAAPPGLPYACRDPIRIFVVDGHHDGRAGINPFATARGSDWPDS